MQTIMKLKSVILLFNLFVSVFVVQGAITTTRQNLDEFSFKKGVKVGGGLSFSNNFYVGSDSLVTRDPYAYYLNGNRF